MGCNGKIQITMYVQTNIYIIVIKSQSINFDEK